MDREWSVVLVKRVSIKQLKISFPAAIYDVITQKREEGANNQLLYNKLDYKDLNKPLEIHERKKQKYKITKSVTVRER